MLYFMNKEKLHYAVLYEQVHLHYTVLYATANKYNKYTYCLQKSKSRDVCFQNAVL